ncbi:MAG TPA: hypothetical protein VNK04_02500 [Gemmataceae bacterium]|nr:hypothetical protein [Gemmataceae bacterium]
MRQFLLLAVILVCVTSEGLGQQIVPAVKSSPATAPAKEPGDQKEPAPARPAEPTAEAASKESPRLQRLKQLQFDRRPSAILKAWSTPPSYAGAQPSETGPGARPPIKDPIDLDLAVFQRAVTLGDWAGVKAFLAGLPEDEGKAAYKQLLQSLQGSPARPMPLMETPGMPPMPMQFAEQNVFAADDVLGLAAAAPCGLDRDLLNSLGALLRRALASGTAVEHMAARLKSETDRPEGQAALTRRQAAQLLAAADQAAHVADFLPSLDQAKTAGDREALNLLARHYLALHAKDKKAIHLERAWEATQAALAAGDGTRADKEEALKRAVELAPKIREELGQTWLEESFTAHPERGMDILATIGGLVSQGLQTQPMNTDYRLKELQLQKTAVEALLKAAPDRAAQWRGTLTLLAGCWMREAEFSRQFDRSSGLGPRLRRDMYGNLFYVNDDDPMAQQMMMRQPNMPQAIRTGDLLQTRPGDAWVTCVDDGLKAPLAIAFAQLYLKVGEEDKAFPFIEQLAGTHPDRARELVNEFLRVWTRNHDPNEARRYTNMYMFMYGFERRAESIPLTRSKQERNLVELAGWVERLRRLPCGEPDEELLAKAFTTCHSSAEVYRLEAIEKVFGPIGGLKPRTLAGLAQQMRENLAGVWRQPAVQNDKKTNRKPKDIQVEVLRGYQVARAVVEDGLAKFPDDWSLHLARAALMHDEINYRQELAKSTDFSAKRDQALAEFQKAARLYAAKVAELPEEEQSTRVYEQWFYASLGACDLQHINEEKLPDLRQPPLIRAALLGLPGEAAERHLGKFANTLFTRLSAVKPEAKFRYLRSGFEIVGDHKQAYEARKVYDYYKDLVTEIKLEAVLDGDAAVGQEPFGVFVNLRHTREIERESGGFGRYLQNQNSMYFAYNYGRPTADYRDKFQAAATEALKEHFDVLSVTFQSENVNSRATSEYGWRVTPYAYLLLKARGPQVDRVPPLRIDLDFLDTSGYVVLPISSPAVPIDAAVAKVPPRPLRKLQVTQILDERQADQGKLVLEVKATGLGLVGELGQVLKLDPEGFEVVETKDQGVSVAKFDPDSDPTAVVSERTWLITLRARPGQPPPKSFRFGNAVAEGTEMVYQRYQDADLVPASEEVSLEREYARRSWAWLWWAVPGAVLGVAFLAVAVRLLLKSRPRDEGGLRLPEKITPFTVTGLLRRIQQDGRLNEAQREELEQTIQLLEQHYFAAANSNGELNLKELAESWVLRVR